MRIIPLLVLIGCDYEAPLDPNAEPLDNVLEGTVILEGVDEAATAVILLSDAADPIPPLGTGSPVDAAAVPGSVFSFDAGLPGAPWSLTGVADGTWLVNGLLDVDGDFQPLVPTLAGATCGDRLGAHVDGLATGVPAAVTVEGGQRITDLAVVIGQVVPFERPAFRYPREDALIDRSTLAGPLPPTFALEAVPIEAEYAALDLSLTGPYDGTDLCDVAFWIQLVDADGDGAVDPHPDHPPETGLLDIWPRAYLTWLGAPVDTDGDDVADAFDRSADPDAAWVSEAFPWLIDALFLPPDDPRVGTTFPVIELDVAWPMAAVRVDAEGGQTPVADPAEVPAGVWSVTLVSFTGQTWTLPNELSTRWTLPEPVPGVLSDIEGQGRVLELR